ncbi:MAG: bile acid:sodium symporter family protein [Novosphingobium sp.]
MIQRIVGRIDPLVRIIAAALILATIIPVQGDSKAVAQTIASSAVFLLFFLNGVRLPRQEVVRGIANWRLLVPLGLFVFIAMTGFGWVAMQLTALFLPPLLAFGFLYLGVLPSTVQSATAYSSLAGGNVAVSVVAAALLNVAGVFISAPLFSALAGSGDVALGTDALIKVFTILLLPFVLGQVCQRWLFGWVAGHKSLVSLVDRGSIGIAVYVAFSGAVVEGVWSRIAPSDWAVLLIAAMAMLLFAFTGAWLASGLLRLTRQDRIAFLYAGAQKSIAMGAPLATVLFAHDVAGIVLIPLLTYHFGQMIVSAFIATHLRTHID